MFAAEWIGFQMIDQLNAWLTALVAFLTAVGLIYGGFRWVSNRPKPKTAKMDPIRHSRFAQTEPSEPPDAAVRQNVEIERLHGRIRQYKSEIARLKSEVAADTAKIRSLENQIAELQARLDDPERAKAALDEARKEARAVLEREGNELDAERVKAAQDAMDDGDFEKAKALFEEIRAREELAVQRAARAAFALGEIAEAVVRWAEAADEFARAAELDATFAHLFKAREYAWRTGRLPQALSFGETLLRVAGAEPTEQRSLALNEHALTLYEIGRYDEAEPLYREALEITRETLGARHPEYAGSLNNLAGLLEATGRYAEAEPLYREALEITRETLGDRHPAYATRLNNLAGLLEATGRYEEAEPLYREALEVLEAVLGAEHPSTQTVRGNLEGFLEGREQGGATA